jgi:hypothetical protein
MKMLRLSALSPAAFSPRKYSWYSFLLEAESTLGPQCGLKNYVEIPMTPSGIEPATFRLVEQCFNQLRYLIRVYNAVCC